MFENRKSLNLLLVFALLLSVMVPSLAMAAQVAPAYTVVGGPEDPSLTIYKYQREKGAQPDAAPGTGKDGQTVPTDAKLIDGVEFTLTLKETFDPATNEWTDAPAGTLLTGTTVDGKVVFDKNHMEDEVLTPLVLGRYDVQETAGPDDVILNTEVYSVDIPMTNAEGNELNYNVTIYPKNDIVRGNAGLTKVNEAGIPINGVKFGLFLQDDIPVKNEDGNIELTTANGGKINFENLPTGEYYVKELSTVDSYALNNNKIKFEVKSDGTKSVLNWTNKTDIEDFVLIDEDGNIKVTNYNVPTIEKIVEGENNINRDKEFQYKITVKTPTDMRKYKSFNVTDTLDENLTFVSNDTVVTGVTFAQNGQLLTWTFDPETAPVGEEVILSFTAKIKANAEFNLAGISNTADLDFDNYRGDSTDTSTDTSRETITTPPVTVYPTDGGFKILKVDKKSRVGLEGAVFKLTTDKEGSKTVNGKNTSIKVNAVESEGLLNNLVTPAGGVITIEGLTPGTYYLSEIEAPTYREGGVLKPYRLLTKPEEIKFVDQETKDVTVENSKSGWNLPTTGGMGTMLFTLIGITFMGAAIFLLNKSRKRTDS